MKLDRKANLILTIIIFAFIALWIFLSILERNVNSMETFTPSLSTLNPCVEKKGVLINQDLFSTEDYIKLCVTVDSSKGNVDRLAQVFVFKDKIKFENQYYYFEYYHITEQTETIPLKTTFEPGYYVFYISIGKIEIGSGSFTIEKK